MIHVEHVARCPSPPSASCDVSFEVRNKHTRLLLKQIFIWLVVLLCSEVCLCISCNLVTLLVKISLFIVHWSYSL